MPGLYNVYIKSVGVGYSADWGEGDAYVVGNYLKELFDQVCSHPASAYSGGDYWWEPNAGDIADHELLVYLVSNRSNSIIRSLFPGQGLGPGGTTYFNNNYSLTEVYFDVGFNLADANPHRGLAVLCFHELMHNKLKRGNSLHTNGGGGLARATVYSNYMLSAENKRLMANALGNKRPQYKGAL
jgi:hypothetical protein